VSDENQTNEGFAPGSADAAKLPWKAPRIDTMEARDSEASFTYGGVDAGIYHS
jgi:hypothetical protein